MNLIQRAKTSITKQPGKTLILFLLVIVLGTAISGAISIQNAIISIDENLRLNMRPIISLDIDIEMLDSHWNEFGEEPLMGFLTPDLVREIGTLSYVEEFIYFVETGAMSAELMQYFYGRDDQHADEGGEFITLHGTSTTDLVQVTEGIIELTQGRTFIENELKIIEEINPAIISDRFAALNNLLLGSVFTLDSEIIRPNPYGDDFDPVWYQSEERIFARQTFEFEVIGIFDVAEIENFENQNLNEDERRILLSRERYRIGILSNPVHIPNIVAEEIQKFEAENRQKAMYNYPQLMEWMRQDGFENRVTTIMLLRDPLEIDDFSEAAIGLLPSEFWQVTYITNDYDHISTAMETMQNIANWLLWGSVGTAIIVLGLLIALFLRDRRHEIGIYLALGEKKVKIIFQIVFEVVIITFLGMSLSLFIGNIASDLLTNDLLRTELLMPRESEWNDTLGRMGFMQSSPDIFPDELVEIFDVSLDARVVFIFYSTGLSVVFVSTILPIIYIVKLKPKKLLM